MSEFAYILDGFMEVLDLFPDEQPLSKELLAEGYNTEEYIKSVYKKCVTEHKPIKEIIPAEAFIRLDTEKIY